MTDCCCTECYLTRRTRAGDAWTRQWEDRQYRDLRTGLAAALAFVLVVWSLVGALVAAVLTP